jgi:ABC-type amino acid transport substrate-binding protein
MKRIVVCCILVAAGWLSLAAAAETTVVVYPRSESASDSQVVYDYEMLRQALEATIGTHGPYELRPSSAAMNQARAADEIAAGSGLVNVLARSTTQEQEQRLLPVRIPIDKGLISYRVFLIRTDMQEKFAAVNTLDDLRSYSVGSYPTWADTRILREAGFKVVTGDSYEGLFRMLVARRFDFFSRSADEAYREYEERRGQLPEMRVEDHLLLHFPTTRFFFVRRSDEGTKLAARIEAGLNRMIKDGSFDALFVKYKGPLIERAHLKTRRAFNIDNAALSPETLATRKARPELWFDPARGR